jgi:hypothetical protein
MRKAFLIIPALLLLGAIGAPNALANTLFTYTYTYSLADGSTFSFTTVPLDPAVALGAPETGITTDSFTGFYSGTVLVIYALDGSSPLVPGANLLTQVTGGPLIGPPEDFFSPSDYTTPGTYNGQCVANCPAAVIDTLTVTPAQTPEPSTYGIMLLGVGLLFVMRKHIGEGLS